jgi:iron-sulfur cluster repair protein YtfE (RIC family)
MNAIDLLKADHAKVQGLLRQYESAGGRQREIAEQIFTELEMHAMLEEELFYPALAGRVGSAAAMEEVDAEEGESEDEGEDLVAEAREEHREVKTLIAMLRALDPGDEQFQTSFSELRESVEEHVGMEEDELMPDAMAALGGELERLGRQMEERKEQLMAGKS